MTEQDIIETINRSLAEEFELDPAAMVPTANLVTDLNLDSLDLVDMVVLLQNVFHIKIREEKAIRDIRTLGDLHQFVIRKSRELPAGPA